MKDQEANINVAKQSIEASNRLISQGKNEQVIRDSFTSYLRNIFPDVPSWVERHIHGGEAAVKVTKREKVTTGFVDNLIDLTAIEYEANLIVTSKFEAGYNQVKDYCASLLNAGNKPDLVIGVLSDTVRWIAYEIDLSSLPEKNFSRENILLREIEKIDVSKADDVAARELIRFLNRYLGRLGSRPVTALSIAQDLGFESDFCQSHIRGLSSTVSDAFSANPKYGELISELWCSFVSYLREEGHSDTFDLTTYVDEFYILTLAKLICANFIEQKALLSNEEELKSILRGEYFENLGLRNFVEYDYFGWLNENPYLDKLIPIAQKIQADLQAYNFKDKPDEDLFGRMMAQLANRSQRLLLGQEWTPSWLSRYLVNHVINQFPDDQPLQLVDMCCGSGSMIVETIKIAKQRIESAHPELPIDQKLQLLSQAITGFDIDPLAVILSRINWILTAIDWLKPFGVTSISLPIYHADSLFAISPLSNSVGKEEKEQDHFILRIAEHSIHLPQYLVSPRFQPFFDALIESSYRIVTNAKNLPNFELTDRALSDVVDSILHLVDEGVSPEQKDEIVNFFEEFTRKVELLDRDGRNGIWAYILRNSYRPGLVAGQFNGLVSNPPWLALSKVANNPYQFVLKEKAEDFAIKPPGSSHLHVELATIFLLHAVDQYLSPNALIGCITPETVLNGHHHNPFRTNAFVSATQPIAFDLQEIWRVQEGVFKNKAIILYGKKSIPDTNSTDPIPGQLVEKTGLYPLIFYRHVQGKRTAWSEKEPSDTTTGFYNPATFREGADIMPRKLFFFEVTPTNNPTLSMIKSIDPISSPLAFSVRDAKKHKDFSLSPRIIPNKFLFDVLTSNLLTPFELASPQKALLPIQKDDFHIWVGVSPVELITGGAAVQNAFRQMSQAVDPSGKLETLMALIDTLGKLTQQVITPGGYLVVTGAGGGKVCSAFAPMYKFDVDKLIVDQTLYWAKVSTEEEAIYLSGLLNSEAINSIIQDFQPQGAFGRRHVHKLPFGVTPPFDPSQAAHQDVVEQTRNLMAEYEVLKSMDEDMRSFLNPNSGAVARRRRNIYLKLKGLSSYNEYEAACRSLYGV
ncbi:MAG: SAM-dependent methyltransferase [Anaerolineae bacterium]|nr:SAM-dependent methyltransferase [Anaerolineae bacterium]